MATTSLYDTNISDTYVGVLHAKGEVLPKTGLQSVFDGAGNESSLKIGRVGEVAQLNGILNTSNNIILNTTSDPYGVATYPRIQFGAIQATYGGTTYLQSDNTDPVYITRVNTAADKSELRINIGDNSDETNFSDKFAVGWTPNSTPPTFKPLLSLNGSGNLTVQLNAHSTTYKRPDGWGGGVTSFDFYSDGGSFGAGKAGTLEAYMNRDGTIFGKNITATNITATGTITAPNAAKSYGYAKTNNFTAGTQTFSTATGFNFASVTWRSKGCYRVTFATPMANDQYAVIVQSTYMRDNNNPIWGQAPAYSGQPGGDTKKANRGDENPLLVKIKTSQYFEFISWSHESNEIENITGFCFVVFGS